MTTYQITLVNRDKPEEKYVIIHSNKDDKETIYQKLALQVRTEDLRSKFKIVDVESVSSCWACRENQPNQEAHMDLGGCLWSED